MSNHKLEFPSTFLCLKFYVLQKINFSAIFMGILLLNSVIQLKIKY